MTATLSCEISEVLARMDRTVRSTLPCTPYCTYPLHTALVRTVHALNTHTAPTDPEISHCYCWNNGKKDITCKHTPWVIPDPSEDSNLFWAYASPCSGGACGTMSLPLPWGWRRASDNEFRSFKASFPREHHKGYKRQFCASEYFEQTPYNYDWCDWTNIEEGWFTHVDRPEGEFKEDDRFDNGMYETFLVHDGVGCDGDGFTVPD